MIIEFPTGKKVEDSKKCKDCKFNCGEKLKNPNEIWCDKYCCYREKNNSCENYKFRYEEVQKIW